MSGKHVYARPHDVVIDGESGMVLADEFELCCDQAVAVDASDRAGHLIVELLPADGVREL